MNTLARRRLLLIAVAGSATLIAAAVTNGGPLAAPAGPVGPTFKTLAEIEPRITINATNTPGDADSMFRITQSGSYVLTENITAAAGKHGIEIAASNVTIDLNGFRIGGPGSGLTCGIYYATTIVGGPTGVVVRNGQITGFSDAGIRLGVSSQSDRVKGGSIENVTLRLNNIGLVCGDGFSLSAVVAEGNGNTGIQAYEGCTISRSVAKNNGQNGMTASTGAVITDSCASGNGAAGIVVGVRSTVSGCTAESNGGDGFSIATSGIATGCIASGNGDDGFTLTGAIASGCTAQSNAGDGFQVGAGSQLRGSLARLNTLWGIRMTGGDSRVEANHVVSNTGGGIEPAGASRNCFTTNSITGHPSGQAWGQNLGASYYGQGALENIVLPN